VDEPGYRNSPTNLRHSIVTFEVNQGQALVAVEILDGVVQAQLCDGTRYDRNGSSNQ
jgi:hypothetical protein